MFNGFYFFQDVLAVKETPEPPTPFSPHRTRPRRATSWLSSRRPNRWSTPSLLNLPDAAVSAAATGDTAAEVVAVDVAAVTDTAAVVEAEGDGRFFHKILNLLLL